MTAYLSFVERRCANVWDSPRVRKERLWPIRGHTSKWKWSSGNIYRPMYSILWSHFARRTNIDQWVLSSSQGDQSRGAHIVLQCGTMCNV